MDARELQRALEARAKEIDQLQHKLQRAEADRQKWENQRRVFESKQPQDVQLLTRQKRELQTQLQREENEKQELFQQINKLIGEVADLQTRAEQSNDPLEAANKRLESQVQQLTNENRELQSKANQSQQQLNTDLQQQRQELERLRKSHELEISRLSADVQRQQKELDVKNAALESLKLAKASSPKEGALEKEVGQLKTELARISQENSRLGAEKLELERFKSGLADEINQLKIELAEQSKRSNQSDRSQNELRELFEHAGIPSTSGIGALKRQIAALKENANEETTRRKNLETELDQLRQTLSSSDIARHELAGRIEELREENERLAEKASLEEELHTLMNSLREAKSEIATKEAETTSWRQKSLRLEEQLDELNSQLKQVRASLEHANLELHSVRASAVDNEILARLEAQLSDTHQQADEERQKWREALVAKDRLDAELQQTRQQLADSKMRATSAESTANETDSRLKQADARRVEDMQRLRDEHRREIDRMRAEFVDEKQRIGEKVASAEADAQKANANVDKMRRSVDEQHGRLASLLDCSPTTSFEEILAKVAESRQRLVDGNSERRAQDVRTTNELNRLKTHESELEAEISRSRQNEQKLKDRIDQMEAELKTRNTGDTERQQLLESDLEELNKMNEELRQKSLEDQRRHDTEMRNMRDEMIENIRRLSDLLETETKRLQTVTTERDRLDHECADLRKQVSSSKQPTPQNLSVDSELAELHAKVAELTDENAQLAGDLLKVESSAPDNEELHRLERLFSDERKRWQQEKAELEARIREMQLLQKNGPLTNGLNGNPTPKPRKLNGNGLASPTELGVVSESSTEETNLTGGDSTKMKSELDKQKRLINVLRKKLQASQIERVRQSQSFCTS